MASIKTKFTVGLFVCLGITFTFVAIIWFGLSHYFEKGMHYVAYFDESVQGLGKDSPVKYRGVSIGRVKGILVAPDSKLIEVLLIIDQPLTHVNGVVAQLKSVGITGIMFVELDRKKKNEPDRSPKRNFVIEYPVISTKPSEIKQFVESLDDLFKRFKAVDIPNISKNLNATIVKIGQVVDEAQVKKLIKDIRLIFSNFKKISDVKRFDRLFEKLEDETKLLVSTTKSAKKTLTKLSSIINNNEKNISEGVVDFRKAMKQIEPMVSNGLQLLNDTSKSVVNIQQGLIVTLQNLEKASNNVNRLTEQLADQPSRILFAAPPEEKLVDPDISK